MTSLWRISGAALILATGAMALTACGSGDGICADFDDPSRSLAVECASANPGDPTALVACLKGGGHAGSWAIDEHGLPAFDISIEHRCDSTAEVESSNGTRQDDPIHVIGNGRGTVAMAHASGAIEMFKSDRGSTWLNKVDDWEDDENQSFPVQLGGGWNYVVVGNEVHSTRYNDFSVSKARKKQTRRFGVGYLETVTTLEGFRIMRRVFASDTNANALVAEVTIENTGTSNLELGLVEFWDLNLHPVIAEPIVAGNGESTREEERVRKRRAAAGEFEHTLSYSRQERVATMQTEAKSLPNGVTDSSSPSALDYFPGDVFLGTIDQGDIPDAAWLSDDELWKATARERDVPDGVADEGDGESRSLESDGAEQRGILALRVPVSVPAGAAVTRRFAFGYATEDVTVAEALDELRSSNGELRNNAAIGWKERLAWMAVDADDSGLVQRELAWSSYYVQAQAIFDALRGVRSVGVGGTSQYVAGMHGNAADLALNAEGLLHINPALARETLVTALSAQHGSTSPTPFRFPDSIVGLDVSSDGDDNAKRSDPYILVPSTVATYVSITRDTEFLTFKAPYWPLDSFEAADVSEHLTRALAYIDSNIEFGAHGLMGMGTGDFGGALLAETTGRAAAPTDASVLNAALAAYGIPLLAEVLGSLGAEGADEFAELAVEQAAALEDSAFNGTFYERAFDDTGASLTPGVMFAATQALPVLAGLGDEDQRDALLDALSPSPVAAADGGPLRPAVNAWVTQAHATRDPAAAWQSLLDNSMAAHADRFPEYAYGVWTTPSSFEGEGQELPGAATRFGSRPDADFPAASTEAHMAIVRASIGLLGILANPTGWSVKPRLPSETFSVVLPNLELHGTPTSLGGSITAEAEELMQMVVTLPSGARGKELEVRVKEAIVEFELSANDTVTFSIPVREREPVTWSVTAL